MSYFVITCGEDGIDVTEFEKRGQMIAAIVGRRFGENAVYLDAMPPIEKGLFRIDFDGVVIIKGEIVKPIEKQKITQWDIP